MIIKKLNKRKKKGVKSDSFCSPSYSSLPPSPPHPLEQVAVPENIIRVKILLDRPECSEARLRNRLAHPLASDLADAVMVRDAAPTRQDFVARVVLSMERPSFISSLSFPYSCSICTY